MLVKDYLKSIGKTEQSYDKITFIITKMVKEDKSPYYQEQYSTTPICSIEELYKDDSKLLNYILLNPKQPPITWASSYTWEKWYERGQLSCYLIISKEDFQKRYPKQADKIVTYIDRYIK